MNAVLQCLAHTQQLVQYLETRVHSSKCKRVGVFCSVCELEKLVHRLSQPGVPSIAPRMFANHLNSVAHGWRLGRQEDAHEYLRCLLEHLTKCSNPIADRPKDVTGSKNTFVQSMFQGAAPPLCPCTRPSESVARIAPRSLPFLACRCCLGLRIMLPFLSSTGLLQSQVRCLSCGAESNTLDPFLDLSLELAPSGDSGPCRSVHEALSRFTKPEYLDGADGYKCESCGRLARARKQFRIATPPRVLTIHLKRFSFDSSGAAKKIAGAVAFEQSMDLSPFMMQGSSEAAHYRIRSILVHEGSSTSSGHYYAYANTVSVGGLNAQPRGSFGKLDSGGSSGDSTRDAWWLLNDHSVRRVQDQVAMGAAAYILVYEKLRTEATGCKPGSAAAAHKRTDATSQLSTSKDGRSNPTREVKPVSSNRLIGPQLPAAAVQNPRNQPSRAEEDGVTTNGNPAPSGSTPMALPSTGGSLESGSTSEHRGHGNMNDSTGDDGGRVSGDPLHTPLQKRSYDELVRVRVVDYAVDDAKNASPRLAHVLGYSGLGTPTKRVCTAEGRDASLAFTDSIATQSARLLKAARGTDSAPRDWWATATAAVQQSLSTRIQGTLARLVGSLPRSQQPGGADEHFGAAAMRAALIKELSHAAEDLDLNGQLPWKTLTAAISEELKREGGDLKRVKDELEMACRTTLAGGRA